MTIQTSSLPDHALLAKYHNGHCYTDCYTTEVSHQVSQERFIRAFYSSPLFQFERTLLKLLAGYSREENEVDQLAAAKRNTFAIWQVEARSEDQLLLREISGRTRSWLMTSPISDSDHQAGTRLYFGSAFVHAVDDQGKTRISLIFRLLGGFHRLYSRLLLASACKQLARR